MDRANQTAVLQRELAFHDELAAATDPSTPPKPLDVLELALLERAGDLTGLDVLDAGCGIGDLTIELARRGARVTALDLSPGMANLAVERTRLHIPDADVSAAAAPIETTGVPSNSFDLVIGKWILHHVDVPAAATELQRVLRPGGRCLFIENSGLNPILRFARARIAGRFGVPRLGTEDEHPLLASDYRLLAERFEGLRLEFATFDFFRILDRQVFRYKSPIISRVLAGIDDRIYQRFTRARRWSFRVIIETRTA